jgi:outer membrane protein with beta-barrel domain
MPDRTNTASIDQRIKRTTDQASTRRIEPPSYRPAILVLAALLVFLLPRPASADITAFLGTNPTPVNRVTTGFGVGFGLIIVGFEAEYGHTRENESELAPSLRTFMFNGLLQTPVPIAGMQFYGTAGGGVYRETLLDDSETNVGINVGGGVKVSLAGPLRLRFDYRVFTLQGNPRHSKPQRFYAGLNLKF